jgi:hypothetical protein
MRRLRDRDSCSLVSLRCMYCLCGSDFYHILCRYQHSQDYISRSWEHLDGKVLRQGCGHHHILRKCLLELFCPIQMRYKSCSFLFCCDTCYFGILMGLDTKCTYNFRHSFCIQLFVGNISHVLICGFIYNFDIYLPLFRYKFDNALFYDGTCCLI